MTNKKGQKSSKSAYLIEKESSLSGNILKLLFFSIQKGRISNGSAFLLPTQNQTISRDIGVRFTFKTWPPVTHKIDPDIDDARYALAEDLIYSQQLAKGGYVKGVGTATRSKPRHNLTGDPFFTDGYRLVLVFDRRPRSFIEIESFNWENPISSRLKRLTVDRQLDFDGGR